jgi:hypothetical protein
LHPNDANIAKLTIVPASTATFLFMTLLLFIVLFAFTPTALLRTCQKKVDD